MKNLVIFQSFCEFYFSIRTPKSLHIRSTRGQWPLPNGAVLVLLCSWTTLKFLDTTTSITKEDEVYSPTIANYRSTNNHLISAGSTAVYIVFVAPRQLGRANSCPQLRNPTAASRRGTPYSLNRKLSPSPGDSSLDSVATGVLPLQSEQGVCLTKFVGADMATKIAFSSSDHR